MKYSDEQLSAFLDRELPHAEMEAIRNALVEDETLGDRLAELSAVDTAIRDTYSAIDDRPLPAAVTDLPWQAVGQPGKVTELPLRRHLKSAASRQLALAASVVLAVGIGLGLWLDATPPAASFGEVAAVLEHRPSGTTVALDDGASVTLRLTFRDKSGNFCRVYDLDSGAQAQQSLACRENGEWQPGATVYVPAGEEQLYRPASGNSPLDHVLDDRIAEGPYDRERESRLIEQTWQ